MSPARLGRLVVAGALVAFPVAAGSPGVAAAEITLCVEVVVDYGDHGDGAPTRPSAYCAKVPDGSTGADVLAVRARELGKPMPRYNDGLLCAIDGFPETGCGEENADGTFNYWSYWHKRGDGAWTYSNRGAYAYTMRDNPDTAEVERYGEGWAWVQNQPEGGRRPANIPYAEVCPTEPAAASSPARPPAPAPRPASSAARPAPAPARTTAAPVPRTVRPSATRSPSAVPTAATSAAASASPAASVLAGSSVRPTPSSTSGERAFDVETRAEVPRTVDDENGLPIGLLVGLLLVAGLGTGAVVQARRRRP